MSIIFVHVKKVNSGKHNDSNNHDESNNNDNNKQLVIANNTNLLIAVKETKLKMGCY